MENLIEVTISSLYYESKELVALLKESFHVANFANEPTTWSRTLWNEILALHALLERAVRLGLDMGCFDGPLAEEAATVTRLVQTVLVDIRQSVLGLRNAAFTLKNPVVIEETLCMEFYGRFEVSNRRLSETLNKLQAENARRVLTSLQDEKAVDESQKTGDLVGASTELCFMDQDEGVGPSTFPEPRRLSRTPSLSLSSAYMRPGVCSMYCRCRCHRAVAQSLSPRTENLLIKIFAHLQGRPQLVKSCNVFNCRMSLSNKGRVVVLHARLFKRILKVAALSENFRLKLSLKAHPVVKDSSDIIKFSEAGDFHRLGRLIKTGRASPSTAGPDGWTLLHNAAYYGHLDVARFLLSLDIDTDVVEVKFRKPAHFAKFRALRKCATENEKLLADLFQESAEFRYDFELSPFHSAVLHEYEITDQERPDLQSLLRAAEEMSEAPNSKGVWTHWKWQHRNRSPLFRELIDWFQTGWKSGESGSQRLRSLLEKPDSVQGWTPLQWAAFVDRKMEFGLLLDFGADPLKITSSGRNVLHQAAESGSDEVVALILAQCYHQKGLQLDLKDIWGETPLIIAAAKTSDSARLLVEHGASLDASQGEGQVPLTQTRYLKGEERRKSVDLLSSKPGLHINAPDVEGRSPIFHLLDTHQCVELLIDRGADIYIRDNRGLNVMHVACVEDRPGTLSFLLSNYALESRTLAEQLDDSGDTPLLAALRTKHTQCAKILLTALATATVKDRKGWSLLHHAVNVGDPILLDMAFNIPGMSVQDFTQDNETVTDVACRLGHKNDLIMDRLKYELNGGLSDPPLQVVNSQIDWEIRGLFR